MAAGRLAERFGRPVVVLNDDGEVSRGSARSVPGFDIARALSGCADLLYTHGGHSQAAGLTLATVDLPRLADRLESAVLAAELPPPGPPALRIEADLPVARLGMATAQLLEALQPFGAGNPVPLLRVLNVRVASYATIGQKGDHLKIWLETGDRTVSAVYWERLGVRESLSSTGASTWSVRSASTIGRVSAGSKWRSKTSKRRPERAPIAPRSTAAEHGSGGSVKAAVSR